MNASNKLRNGTRRATPSSCRRANRLLRAVADTYETSGSGIRGAPLAYVRQSQKMGDQALHHGDIKGHASSAFYRIRTHRITANRIRKAAQKLSTNPPADSPDRFTRTYHHPRQSHMTLLAYLGHAAVHAILDNNPDDVSSPFPKLSPHTPNLSDQIHQILHRK